jgi:hypothetical protein
MLPTEACMDLKDLLERIKAAANSLLQNVAATHRLVFEGDGLKVEPGSERKRLPNLDPATIREVRTLYEEIKARRGPDPALNEFVRTPVHPEPAAKALLRIHHELNSGNVSKQTRSAGTDDDGCALCGADVPAGSDICDECRDM